MRSVWNITYVFWMVVCCFRLSLQECVEFTEIDPENYDRGYSEISAGNGFTGARPLGFIKDTLVYQGNENPCFKVTGEVGQQVEIKFETVPSMRLCVRGKGTNYERCAEGRFSDCMMLSQASTDIEFFCDVARGCAEGDVNFWLRITKGPTPAEDTEAMWCHDLSDEYPESLRPLPSGFFTERPTKPASGTSVPVMSSVLSVICLIYSLIVGH